MSSSSRTSVKREKGFEERDVRAFMQMGNRLGSDMFRGANLKSFRPKKKEKITEISTYEKKGVPGFHSWDKSTSYKADAGFSKTTDADLDRLTEIFMARKRQIDQKRLAPGRSALFLGGR